MTWEPKDLTPNRPLCWRHPLVRFSFGRYRFVLEVMQRFRLRAFATATLRGGLGHILKKTVCTWPPGDCSQCRQAKHCPYSYLFETKPTPGSSKLRNLDQVPRPYVISLPYWEKRLAWWSPAGQGTGEASEQGAELAEGELLECEVTLMGRAVLFLPYFLFAFQKLGRRGVGGDRGKFRVVEVRAVCLPTQETKATGRQMRPLVYHWRMGLCGNDLFTTTGKDVLDQWQEQPRRLTVAFHTPTRLEHEGQVCREITFTDLVRALLRRLSSLSYFHCGFELQLDYSRLIEDSRLVQTTASELAWQDQARFSTRQKQRIWLGGVVGHVTYEAPCSELMAHYLPLLALGQYVHVGKGAVMGLGKFSVRNADWYTGPRKRSADNP